MTYEEMDVSYPPVHPGTDRTFIRFYTAEKKHGEASTESISPDLNSIFYSESSSAGPMRIFVTDTHVSSLPSLESFFSSFRADCCVDGCCTAGFIGTRGKDILVVLGSGETYKTIESVLTIASAALDHNAQRSSVFVGIGGGVICDMTSFAASIFKRGAQCELVPTTLLSMVDASVGGKTGCDFSSYKNMIGTFFPAQKINICPQFVQTLPGSQYRSGMAEVVKTALLYSPELFVKLENNRDAAMARKSDIVFEMIQTCVTDKAKVVEQDLTEKNIRMQLNFGHTFGHALETCAGLGVVSHGDAVAWGIARALTLSEKLGLCTAQYKDRVIKMLASYGWETGAQHSSLREKFGGSTSCAHELFDAMKKDKKNNGSRVRFVLQKELGNTVITEADEDDVLSVLTND
jgi:3-dehydroquinate synthase